MAGSSYLNTLLKTLPAEQSRQIIEILNGLQNSGGILSPDDFNQKLKELTSVVNKDGRILPTIQLLLSFPMQLCRSSIHNTMLTSAKNDIQSAFLQTDEIGMKLEDHNVLFIDNMIRDLEASVSHQEETIKRLKWLADRNNEFTHCIVDQFSTVKSLDKSSSEIKKIYNIYFDDRFSKIQSQLFYDAFGKKVLLPTKNNIKINATSVLHLSDSYSFITENEVEDPKNKLVNIIDGKKGTFWTRNVYSSDKLPKVTTVLRFNFDTAKDVSYVCIESGASEQFDISSIIGTSSEGNQIVLLSNTHSIDGRTRIDFDNIHAKAITIFFETNTYRKIDYFVPKDIEVLDLFEGNDVFSKLTKKEKIGKIVRKKIISDNLADICSVSDTELLPKIDKYNYQFCLDNVWFGSESYDSSGIFVSKQLKIENVGSVGVNAISDVETDGNISDSIEYEITKIDSIPRYNVLRVPIPEIGQRTVSSERLIFSGQIYDSTVNDLAFLRFCPLVPYDWAISDESPVKVYKNGKEIYVGTDWEFSFRTTTTTFSGTSLLFESNFLPAADFGEWNLLPQRMAIVIKNIDPNAVYTASYTIRFSDYINGGTVWLDSEKNSYLVKDKVVFKKTDNLVKSNIYLVVKMRKNLASKFFTPKLYEYSLLGSSYN